MKKVLIIDDDYSIRDALSIVFESLGIEFALAADGNEGLALLDESISLILLDLQMPNLDGYGFHAMVQETAFVSVPIVVMTAQQEPKELANVQIVAKPLNLGLIYSLLEKHRIIEKIPKVS